MNKFLKWIGGFISARLGERTTWAGVASLGVMLFSHYGIDVCSATVESFDWGQWLPIIVSVVSGGAIVLPMKRGAMMTANIVELITKKPLLALVAIAIAIFIGVATHLISKWLDTLIFKVDCEQPA